MDMNQIVKGVVLEKVCSIKPDKDSTESKQITLRVKFDGVMLSAVFAKAVSGAVIQWQNGPGRSKFDSWQNGQIVEIEFKAPAKQPTLPPEDAIVAKAKAMTPEERKQYAKALKAKLAELDQ